MKAITLWQPWASLVGLGEKKIETRSWLTKYRGPLAIHAAATCKKSYMDLAWQEPFYSALLPLHKSNPTNLTLKDVINCPLMSIIAICNLVDCFEIRTVRPVKRNGEMVMTAFLEAGNRLVEVSGNELVFGDYTPGRYAWILSEIKLLETPVPAKGKQRLWNWEPPEEINISQN